MARFSGKVGYVETTDSGNGVHIPVATERVYSGDVTRNNRQIVTGEKVNSDLSVQNTISVVADEYANGHVFAIRYVEWMGVLWSVTDVEIQHPRLLLRLGSKYNGPTPG